MRVKNVSVVTTPSFMIYPKRYQAEYLRGSFALKGSKCMLPFAHKPRGVQCCDDMPYPFAVHPHVASYFALRVDVEPIPVQRRRSAYWCLPANAMRPWSSI